MTTPTLLKQAPDLENVATILREVGLSHWTTEAGDARIKRVWSDVEVDHSHHPSPLIEATESVTHQFTVATLEVQHEGGGEGQQSIFQHKCISPNETRFIQIVLYLPEEPEELFYSAIRKLQRGEYDSLSTFREWVLDCSGFDNISPGGEYGKS